MIASGQYSAAWARTTRSRPPAARPLPCRSAAPAAPRRQLMMGPQQQHPQTVARAAATDTARAMTDTWLRMDADPASRARVAEMVQAGDEAALADLFCQRLEFGESARRRLVLFWRAAPVLDGRQGQGCPSDDTYCILYREVAVAMESRGSLTTAPGKLCCNRLKALGVWHLVFPRQPHAKDAPHLLTPFTHAAADPQAPPGCAGRWGPASAA
jgi:hypothetical protein